MHDELTARVPAFYGVYDVVRAAVSQSDWQLLYAFLALRIGQTRSPAADSGPVRAPADPDFLHPDDRNILVTALCQQGFTSAFATEAFEDFRQTAVGALDPPPQHTPTGL